MEKIRRIIELGKIDYLGIGRKENLVTVEVELEEREEGKVEFSCCGNIWNRIKSDILCGGQCLDEIKEYTEKGLSPADIIQKNWNGSWNKDLRKLIKYLNSKN